MSHIVDNVLCLVGDTPLVRLNRIGGPENATILAKLESQNPAGSIKDRIAVAMIDDAERSGRLRPGATIVEPTSGNTGIGLAMVAAVRGYRLILTLPDDMSTERRTLLALYGAEIILTPAIEGMSGAVFAAQEIVRKHGYFMPQQFVNPANPEIHRKTTAREILEATDGEIDAVVLGVGTGGTITGVGEVLKKELEATRPGLLIVAVEPSRAAVLSGGRPAPHGIQGIGAGFVPAVLNRSIIDRVITVNDDDAVATARDLARLEGLVVGISSGASVFASVGVARELGPGRTVVTVLPDTGDRYISAFQAPR
ncbi:MAG TPA: cysteine synthase A [Chloroflexota bacterium]|nr:cysteine synthase A [Chloroflexota bacterium]